MAINRSLNEKFAYAPFKGGAGPTAAQSQACNNALMAALVAEGMHPRWERDEIMDEQWVAVGGDGDSFVTVAKAASYDRWGFCSVDGELDNVDLATAVAYFKGELD